MLEELKNRGFFTIPTDLHEREEINSITVSVEESKRDVYTTWQKDWDKKKRRSESDS
ncbi:hypothetical protein [Chryseobacterium sp. NKUCC03_KSP]|uniref:hypothetical protein n=1 Tax=Chryseobacterium sp. NKUCC03_KSP TaxID=2842125 RepID=UPI000FBC3EE9|nr:hypothetical protein [Chryseobacterium sp. NKUCC03_KSP]MBW3523345.1 hypothetical protein [Chryseobacterium sp. NKUCC03_KSP]